MIISKLKLKNWKNFKEAEVDLKDRVFIVGANASGKSNFLDAFRFCLWSVLSPTTMKRLGFITHLACGLPEVVTNHFIA